MQPRQKQLLFIYLYIGLLILLDQISKSYLITYLKTEPDYTIHILPILDFTYSWNHGISFGLFNNYHKYSNLFFITLNSGITFYLIYLVSLATAHSVVLLVTHLNVSQNCRGAHLAS